MRIRAASRVAAAEAAIFVTRITIRNADLQVSDPISGSVRMRTKPQKKALAVNEGLRRMDEKA